MTFYNHIESARYEMSRLVSDWTSEGAETKARISESLDQARREYVQMESENAKLRELVHKQDVLTKAVHAYWSGGERSLDDFNVMMDANAQVLSLMRELGIEVDA